jgi:3-hydroxy-D-aspartate aldolase
MIAPPAHVGMAVEDVDTPALIVDLDAFEHNLHQMQHAMLGSGVSLRPHAKTHKSPLIAALQIAHGAVGVCCQKVSEAEIMVAGGVRDVLVANQIVGRRKAERLAALARHAEIGVCVDCEANITELEAAAARFGSTLRVLVEMDVGAHRCGVPEPGDVVALARMIDAQPHLCFGGIQAYQGAAQHLRAYAERQMAIARATERVLAARHLLAAAGLRCETVTGAGTGTFEFELASGAYTEIQAGSYIFMDRDYGLNQSKASSNSPQFAHALFLLATVMSRPAPGRIILDAGLKAFSVDAGMPELRDRPGLCVSRASDEHGRVDAGPDQMAWSVGDKIWLIPGHCDPTVNLHDWMVCVRSGMVEALWPISARGAVF